MKHVPLRQVMFLGSMLVFFPGKLPLPVSCEDGTASVEFAFATRVVLLVAADDLRN